MHTDEHGWERHQRQLLEQIRMANRANPISAATEQAYLETPRHRFVPRYRRSGVSDWCDVNAGNLAEHLPALYANGPVVLFCENDGEVASTISQPSLVLRMLDLLRVEPGQKVLELGGGSGWNAALLGRLVGPAGHVYSLEIIPEMARRAAAAIEAAGIRNVSIINGDGGEGYAGEAPYDRAIFTAGCYDLPQCFYEQLKDGGLLLVLVKTEGGGDNLFLLRKTADHFESLEAMHCWFLQVTGKHRNANLEPMDLEQAPEWVALRSRECGRSPFWWGGRGPETFVWRTWGIRSFLSVTEPLFQAFQTGKTVANPYDGLYFGLWDRPGESLVVARDDMLISYGTLAAQQQLLRDVERWTALGMPTTTSMKLQVFRREVPLAAGLHQWIVRRSESLFLWSLPGPAQ